MTVYRRIMLASQACYGARPFRVDGEFFQDKDAAEITIASTNIVYIAALYISIKATSDNVTTITTYYAPGLNNEWKTAAEDTKQWQTEILMFVDENQRALSWQFQSILGDIANRIQSSRGRTTEKAIHRGPC